MAAIFISPKSNIRFIEIYFLIQSPNTAINDKLIRRIHALDYKGQGGFQPTKNRSSVRKIQINWQTFIQFSELVNHMAEDKPIFIKENKKVYNSTVNDVLERHCKKLNIPTISLHGLRHTHASLLLFAGVSITSVARRLGHASINTTQKTYLHIIQQLENKDIDLIIRSLLGLS